LLANILRHNTVQVVVPLGVLVDELVGGRLIALVLNLQSLRQHLADDPRMRDWINRYASGKAADLSNLPGGPSDNVLWAAGVWHDIKKHWCLEAQRLIRARQLDAVPASQSAQLRETTGD